MTVRLRIAPSPTGLLHVGNARAAVFNWLFARHHGGIFIVRVDDTDRARSEEQYVRQMIEAFTWLGLDWDEGVGVGGPHGTYRQSDRFARYQAVADQLVGQGAAYPCFCTPDELDARRKLAQEAGRPPGYDGRCRALDPGAAASRRERGDPASIRMAVPRPGVTLWQDLVRDEMRFDHEVIDDFVVLRSNGVPTYHLASTVDDVDYEITHVARGEDLLSSTPKHIIITEAMGARRVAYAHLPLLFGPDGKKLSKRHGDTSMASYMEAGYLPEAMFNYMSLLGWSYDPEVTIYSKDDAVARFELADVSKNPAIFDTQKLLWMNGEYIRAMGEEAFFGRSLPFLEAGLGRALDEAERNRFRSLSPLIQERVKLLPEVTDLAGWAFIDQLEYEPKSWSKVMDAESVPGVLQAAEEALAGLSTWETVDIEAAMRTMLDELGLNARKGFQPLRVALTGSQVSPPLFESMAALGREPTLRRISDARQRLAG